MVRCPSFGFAVEWIVARIFLSQSQSRPCAIATLLRSRSLIQSTTISVAGLWWFKLRSLATTQANGIPALRQECFALAAQPSEPPQVFAKHLAVSILGVLFESVWSPIVEYGIVWYGITIFGSSINRRSFLWLSEQPEPYYLGLHWDP